MNPTDMNTPTVVYDARDYDRRTTDTHDVALWLHEARSADGPVLELGVGTGRIAIPLAAAGLDVTGIDTSESMLKRARGKSGGRDLKLSLIRADMRRFDLAIRFGFIYAPLAAINHMSDSEAALDCFRCVRNHLTPGGIFMIDTFNNADSMSVSINANLDTPTAFRTWSLQELDDLLIESQFQITGRYGDYDMTPYDTESPRLILKAAAR